MRITKPEEKNFVLKKPRSLSPGRVLPKVSSKRHWYFDGKSWEWKCSKCDGKMAPHAGWVGRPGGWIEAYGIPTYCHGAQGGLSLSYNIL